jgi:hypothetical protein
MSLHDLAMAAAELTERQGLPVFPVPGCEPTDAVDRPQRAYRLFTAHPAALFIGVPTGVETMIVAITVEAAALRWRRSPECATTGETTAAVAQDGVALPVKGEIVDEVLRVSLPRIGVGSNFARRIVEQGDFIGGKACFQHLAMAVTFAIRFVLLRWSCIRDVVGGFALMALLLLDGHLCNSLPLVKIGAAKGLPFIGEGPQLGACDERGRLSERSEERILG